MKYPNKQMAWNINMAIIQYHDITIIITYSPPLACYQNWTISKLLNIIYARNTFDIIASATNVPQ